MVIIFYIICPNITIMSLKNRDSHTLLLISKVVYKHQLIYIYIIYTIDFMLDTDNVLGVNNLIVPIIGTIGLLGLLNLI